MTDRDLEGLRGKVRMVESSSVDVGADFQPLRKPEVLDIAAYDENGVLTSTTSYWTGERKVYFILDGEVVSKTERILAEPRIIIQEMLTIDRPGVEKTKDRRYDTKYKYEYDKNGRLVEVREYMNDERLWSASKFGYGTDRRILWEKGTIENSPRFKNMIRYDSNGNEIETTSIDYDSEGNKVTQYFQYSKYKFDEVGNWIERIETTLDSKKKKTRVGLARRNLTYY